MNSETKNCKNCKKDFTIEPDDFTFYEKMEVPAPTWCPECRVQRRLAFRDYRVLYKRKDDHDGKEIFSIFPQDSPFKVYERDYWWSDNWDPIQYGQDYDFSKPFFEQLKELMFSVPQPSRTVFSLQNSDYSTGANNLKNCYLVFVATGGEDCMYSSDINQVKASVDVTQADSSESCYGSFQIVKCYKAFYSSHCENCVDVWFSKNLQGCNNCFGCTNLNNKSYYIFNKPYTKEDYIKKIKEFHVGSHSSVENIKKQTFELFSKSIVRCTFGKHNAGVSGEYIDNSKNVRQSYYVRNAEDCKYVQKLFTPSSKDCYDVSQWGENIELVYEASSCGSDSSRIKFCYRTYFGSHDCEYCMQCTGCSYLFGCVGLQKNQYCIFNKQYTKEEYETLVPRIKKHMDEMPFMDKNGRVYKYGEFFPSELSPFSYNESAAKEFFVLTKDEALKAGYRWKDIETRPYALSIKSNDLPDDIMDTNESVLKETIGCAHGGACDDNCTVAYKITPEELKFYKQMNIPLPRLCHNCRHAERIKERRPIKIWHRKCAKCDKDIETSYAPDRPEIVYCESCYNAEVA